MKEQNQQSQLKMLISKGKEQGYLTYAEVNDHLPEGIVDPEQIEDIIGMIKDMGIMVQEHAPDADSLLISDKAVTADDEVAAEEAAAALALVDSEFGRTTDPVRMYMREMGVVELLTREGEIKIAKRIEDGLNQMLEALATHPETITTLLDDFDQIATGATRLANIVTGFIDLEADNTKLANLPEDNSDLKANDADDDDEDARDDGDEDAANVGLDIEDVRVRMENMRSLQTKYQAAVAKHGKDHARCTKLHEELIAAFMEFKLAPKMTERLVNNLRELVERIRNHERVTMDLCTNKGRMPRKDFIVSFPGNETISNGWTNISSPIKATPRTCKQLLMKYAVRNKNSSRWNRNAACPLPASRTSTARCPSVKPKHAVPKRKWSKPTCDWSSPLPKNTPTVACNFSI